MLTTTERLQKHTADFPALAAAMEAAHDDTAAAAGEAAVARGDALDARDAAAVARAAAEHAASSAYNAFAGPRYATHAIALSVAAGLAIGTSVLVEEDETASGQTRSYRVGAGGTLTAPITIARTDAQGLPEFALLPAAAPLPKADLVSGGAFVPVVTPSGETRNVSVRSLTDYYNVQWEDANLAPGDDATAALNAASLRVEAAGGGRILLPEGVWGHSGPVLLGEGVTLSGLGPGRTILRAVPGWRGGGAISLGVGARPPTVGSLGVLPSWPGTGFAGLRCIRYCAIKDIEIDANWSQNVVTLGQAAAQFDYPLAVGTSNGYGVAMILDLDNVYAHDVALSCMVIQPFPYLGTKVRIRNLRTANAFFDTQGYINNGAYEIDGWIFEGYSKFPYVQGYGGGQAARFAFQNILPHPSDGIIRDMINISQTQYGPGTHKFDEGVASIHGVRVDTDFSIAPSGAIISSTGPLSVTGMEIIDRAASDHDRVVTVVRATQPGPLRPTKGLRVSFAANRVCGGFRVLSVTASEEMDGAHIEGHIRYREGVLKRDGSVMAQIAKCKNVTLDVTMEEGAPSEGIITANPTEGDLSGIVVSGNVRAFRRLVSGAAISPAAITFRDACVMPDATDGGVPLVPDDSHAACRFENVRTEETSNSLTTGVALTTLAHLRRYDNRGRAVFDGTGAQTAFVIPHGLVYAPTLFSATDGSASGMGAMHVTADATNITVTFAAAPPEPDLDTTGNVVLMWEARYGA